MTAVDRSADRHSDRLTQMQVRLPPALHDQLRQRAVEEDRSMSQVIRRALRLYLSQPWDGQ